MFQGSMVALITPMHLNGELDEQRLRELVLRHVDAGTNAIIVNGTTGEMPTLTEAERIKIIQIALESANGKIPIVAGTGTYSTRETIYRTEQAMQLGVAACLLTTPYYNRPSQQGLYEHFKAVAKAVPISLILYNVPKRSGCDLLPDTIQRLTEFSNIVGVKEATGDLSRAREILACCGERLALYSGDDASALAFMLQGGKGVISVTANVAPKQMVAMCHAALVGDLGLAGQLNTPLMALHKNLFLEANPIPVKWAAATLGWIEGGIRLPLTPLAKEYHEPVSEAMKIAGVI